MSQPRLFVDMDGTLARFHDEVDYIERMYEPGFFEHLNPFEQMLGGIRQFIEQHPDVSVYTCSSVVQSQYCISEKNRWLDRYLPEVSPNRRIFTAIGRSKAEAIPNGVTKDDYLLDDYNPGLHLFRYGGGSAIKCHNNINQQGRGEHGGEQGYMWEGPIVHTDDNPALIAAELAQLMGLEYNLEQAAAACHVQYSPFRGHPIFQKRLERLEIGTDQVYAARSRYKEPWTEYFTNPFNALRFLCGDSRAREYKLRSYDGTELRLSGYQLEAICQNAYGDHDFQKYLQADRAQLTEDAILALSHRDKAVVGFVCQLCPDHTRFCMTPYYEHASMETRIEQHKRKGEPYFAEYFVDPKLHSKQRHALDQTLKNAMRRVQADQSTETIKRSNDAR